MEERQAPPTMGTAAQRTEGPPRLRPFTVNEALQYSPFSSIVPFSSETVPRPTFGYSKSAPLFESPEAQAASKKQLEALDQDIRSSHGQSLWVDQNIQDLQRILDPTTLTKIIFKSNIGSQSKEQQINGQRQDDASAILSPFAKMLLDSTSLDFGYAMPKPPKPKVSNIIKQTAVPNIPARSNPSINQTTPTFKSESNGTLAGTRTPDTQQSAPKAAVPQSFDSSYYKDSRDTAMREESEEESPSKKRKREDEDVKPVFVVRVDQKQVTDASLRSLQDLLESIFEAEDQLQPDTSGAVSTHAAEFFDDGQTLAPDVLLKVEKAMTKVIADGRFQEIPVDDVSRLQKICQVSINIAESVDIKVRPEWTDADVEIWLHQVEIAERGLRSVRTVLKTMTGGRVEKQLYSEEMIGSGLTVLRHVLDDCIVPIVELRSAGSSADLFKSLSSQKKTILGLVSQASKVFNLLSTLLAKEEISDEAVNTVEAISIALVFVENGHIEKDSVLGIQKFERLRVLAVDALAKIFSVYSEQRISILDDILTSLEKLPVTRQSARQFKLPDGHSIQLVAALLMILVQTSATKPEQAFGSKASRELPLLDSIAETGLDNEDGDDNQNHTSNGAYPSTSINNNGIVSEAHAVRNPRNTVQNMLDVSSVLSGSAQKTAHYVVQFMVSRALKSTKSGDTPYRNLLDIFTEDFILVLDSPDWPASELMLRNLLTTMIGISATDKSTAPAKNMALDLIGPMGSAISNVLSHSHNGLGGLNASESEVDTMLSNLGEEALEGKANEREMLAWMGPYRVIVEHLKTREGDASHIQSARGYQISQWATNTAEAFDRNDEIYEDVEERTQADADLAAISFKVEGLLSNDRAMDLDRFDNVTSPQVKLAYAMIVLNTPFCKLFGKIMDVLLTAMMSDQATVRSKSLKSIVQLLEGDSSILERNDKIVRQIIQRTLDPSPLVRDSAVTLLGRCLSMKASIEHDVYEILLARAADTAPGIRKKSMKLLKDIYLNSKKREIRTSIADALLHRINDTDEGVSELARSMFEEIWMSPYYRDSDAGEEPLQYRLALKDQVSLIVKTVQRGESVAGVLRSLLKTLLLNGAKSSASNFRVCKSMVATMFDIIIDVDDSLDQTEVLTRQHILQTLSIFAEASPKLFSPDQLKQLQPYVDNLSSSDDISIYRAVLVIYKLVLPVSSNIQTSFLSEVQDSLLKSIQKLAKKEQDELVACLWMIDRVLHNTERLSRVALSCLKGVYGSAKTDFNNANQKAALGRVVRYINIAGLFGKHCDFDETQIKIFRQGFPEWKGSTVSGLMVDLFSQFTNPKQPLILRKSALDGICSICQTWPKHYMKATVCSSFEIVFSEQNRDLENLVLQGFKAFMSREEKQSEAGVNALDGAADDAEPARLSGAIATNENDGVSTSLAQRYLKPILRIALSAQDTYALTAVELVASINRQGLVHPKESGPVLVALETSLNTNIAAIAFREHRTLHQKHETIVEKEYMKAVQQAFIYQRDVVGDPIGATTKPYASKLRPLFDVIKISKGKVRKKFLGNLCNRVDFDPAKIDASAELPPHVQFSRFIIENIAFFEYTTIDELLHILGCMERIVKSTGTSIAHSMETEIFKVKIAPIDIPTDFDMYMADSFPTQAAPIDEKRLRQLTASAMILTALWQCRTFLRRSYGSTPGVKQRDSKAKISLKDLAKSPIRLAFVSGDKFWEDMIKTMAALESGESMLALCKEFVELMAVDQEFKIASASEEETAEAVEQPQSASDEEDSTDIPSTPGSSGRSRKRKSSSGGPGGRSRKKSKTSGRRSRGGSIHSNEEHWE